MAKHDNWSTPPDLANVLHQEFMFTEEICAAKDNRCIPTIPYMGLDNACDALIKPWGYVNYCNPPYSMLTEFVNRAEVMSRLGGLTSVLLIPAYTDTKYFQEIIGKTASEVRLLKGRLRFWENQKPGKDTARFSSAIVIWRGGTKNLQGPNIWMWDWQ